MGVVSRKWMWVEIMGVASGYGCKKVYRFPHITSDVPSDPPHAGLAHVRDV